MKHLVKHFLKSVIALTVAMASLAHADDAGSIVFVAGKAEISGKAAVLNTQVAEGAELSTGADGYLYLKTVDNGFFIMRPNSRARIVAYHIDASNPANTRIKLELLHGVARSISGDAVKQARQNFRFNTPVAAIGVRGTDFTVYTSEDISRVAVISGGIVVSGFGQGCAPQGSGPCEGSASTELFSAQQGQLLQITKDQLKPLLMRNNASAPDAIAPPRADEPVAKAPFAGVSSLSSVTALPAANDVNLDPLKTSDIKNNINEAFNAPVLAVPVAATPVITTPPVIAPPAAIPVVASQIIWGRWVEVLGQSVKLDFVKLSGETKKIAILDSFAIFQEKNAEWAVPDTGTMGFALSNSEAYVRDEAKGLMSAAQVQNASLNVDFAKAAFTTSFDLLTAAASYKLHGDGSIDRKGQFSNDNIFTSNMLVQGVLSAENGGAAAYLFKSRLDDTHIATGATFWGKK
jgi:hypothetical protein